MPRKAASAKRVNKAQWLDTALQVLEAEGISGVRIEVLARRLAISKSGFYWHFRDRDHLLDELLDYWTHEISEVVTANTELLGLEPKRRLLTGADMIRQHELWRYEIPVRQWALHDTKAARAVQKVNRIRLDYVRGAFSELGFTGDELETRTTLFTCYQTWESPMYRGFSNERRRSLIERCIELLTSS